MTGTILTAAPGPGRQQARSWEQVLRAAVRPEFAVDVVRPVSNDPVLFGPRLGGRGLLGARAAAHLRKQRECAPGSQRGFPLRAR
jgi:hypothetical protein